MGQRDSPFVPLAGGSTSPPGPCRPIRRAERELGPQKGARSATPNSNRPRSLEVGGAPFGRCLIGAVCEGPSCELRWRVPGLSEPRNGFSRRFGTIPGFPDLGSGRFAPERAVLARNRAFRAPTLVARPGKPGIVPSCAAERRQTPARPPRWRQPFENQLPSPGGPFRLEASLPPNPLQTGKPLSERSRLAPCDAQQAFGLGERWQAC